MSVLRSTDLTPGDLCRKRLRHTQTIVALQFHLLSMVVCAIIKWLASLTLGEIARALWITVFATVVIPSALLVFVVWYVPITIGALVYNRTLARMLGRRAFRPFW